MIREVHEVVRHVRVRVRHCAHRAESQVLVVSQQKDDVGRSRNVPGTKSRARLPISKAQLWGLLPSWDYRYTPAHPHGAVGAVVTQRGNWQ